MWCGCEESEGGIKLSSTVQLFSGGLLQLPEGYKLPESLDEDTARPPTRDRWVECTHA